MLSALRSRLTYANVTATLALFLALSGGAAYAANHYLITSPKQIKPSVLSQLKGNAGAAGAAGAPGAAGPGGPQGPGGAQGPGGPQGPAGGQGAPGSQGATGKNGTNGVNGINGVTGVTGSPWTAGGTLPTGSSERGVVDVAAMPVAFEGKESAIQTISFTIPLASKPKMHVIMEGETPPAGCKGSVTAAPEAESGNLCVFLKKGLNVKEASVVEIEPNGVFGAYVWVVAETAGTKIRIPGNWVVTG